MTLEYLKQKEVQWEVGSRGEGGAGGGAISDAYAFVHLQSHAYFLLVIQFDKYVYSLSEKKIP